jgi:hypothetical protein
MSEKSYSGELFGAEHSIPIKGSRAYFLKFEDELPAQVLEQLKKKKLLLSDYSLYSVKQIVSKTVKMFETQDVRESSLRNVSAAKLSKNQVFLVHSITVLAGVPADLTSEKVKATDFKSIGLLPALANGEFSLKANKVTIVSENMSMRKFVTDNNHNVAIGYFELDNPRLIKDDELIEFVIELGSMDGLDAKTHFYVALNGTGTTP